MEIYKNSTGNGGVEKYEIGPDWIKIRFVSSEKIYVYSYSLQGKKFVEKMKLLAQQGKGLTTFINEYIRYKYDHVE